MRKALKRTRLHEQKLPSHSPELNAAEPWGGWAKEVLSGDPCWEDRATLLRAFLGFVASMARRTDQVLQRCVPEMWGFNRG